jgi:DNA-binding XRE family transcriptional regulator
MSIGRQISAARGLLRWSGALLAEKAGLTRDTINKIESDMVQPREGTVADIIRVFDEHGVEFTENSGVRFRPEGVEVLVGKEGLRHFFDGVYDHLNKHGGIVQITGIDEALFTDCLGEYSPMHIKRMTDLVERRPEIKFQTLIREGDMNFACSDYSDYRWQSKEVFVPVPFYIYGDCLGIISFQTIPAPTIVLHKITAITHAYRKQFDAMWQMGKVPPKGKKK